MFERVVREGVREHNRARGWLRALGVTVAAAGVVFAYASYVLASPEVAMAHLDLYAPQVKALPDGAADWMRHWRLEHLLRGGFGVVLCVLGAALFLGKRWASLGVAATASVLLTARVAFAVFVARFRFEQPSVLVCGVLLALVVGGIAVFFRQRAANVLSGAA